ncbi:hypothetical protein TDIS_0045 [Thermosulfurimonas dismutans]|uniref:Uncharacterized protein n=1 Tax=Thermosulfurimonas dismutans TaxID=999894 RepID=A0A179D649_9BACT|nr:hypothetical protein TDIS_0045 [Thermosulfurimonas dismutans]
MPKIRRTVVISEVVIFDHFPCREGAEGVRRRKGSDPERPLAGDFSRNIPLSAGL